MKDYILKDKKLSIISRISIIFIWMILSRYINNEVIFPSISNTFFSIVEIMEEPFFLIVIKNTMLRTFIGFSISFTIAIAIGVLSSISKIAYNFMIPILRFLNSIPTIAIILLALIWLNNELVPMFVGFIMVFPILYENILNSILDVDKNIIQMAKLYRVKKARVIKDIYMPSIIYNISKIFNSAIGINLKMVIAGEVLSQPKYSIGSSLQLERMYLNTSGVFAWIILIILISRVFDLIGNVIKYSLGNDRWM